MNAGTHGTKDDIKSGAVTPVTPFIYFSPIPRPKTKPPLALTTMSPSDADLQRGEATSTFQYPVPLLSFADVVQYDVSCCCHRYWHERARGEILHGETVERGWAIFGMQAPSERKDVVVNHVEVSTLLAAICSPPDIF